ncbi:OmpH family outer membrane protein [Roseofilum casamattae]|uniref:OmpH family outer membrane protein n=1 Tax=Roseofilum casamattae BLCC-M143 TaxID=3022442 RepID=A0ABT7BU67_9CYAN|nr:OmpH family outer membrane protein [Roseofilum casamattae]MDJ1182732.1 OmpH family outer membrane protein [Roseofilum casamattae BLCC-M143]
MALIDQWRSQRHQRQLDDRNRRVAVQTHIQRLNTQRQLETQQLQANLHQFRNDLARSEADRSLEAQERQSKLQATIVQWQQYTQTSLQQARSHRQEQHQALQHELQEYIEDLRLQIASYFQYLEELRQQRQEDIEERKANFATFQVEAQEHLQHCSRDRQSRARAEQLERHNHRMNLYRSVWGDGELPELPAPTPAPEPIAVKPTPSTPQTTSAPLPPSDTETINFSSTEEEQVYTFLQKSPDSRLSAIEGALGINRIQAVDTLRSLIKRGLVTQRDRLYSVI